MVTICPEDLIDDSIENTIENVGNIVTDVNDPIQIDFEDIQEEVDFLNSSIVCYVVGANPLIRIMEGFIRRIWKKLNVEEVVLVKEEIYMVRFMEMDSKIRS